MKFTRENQGASTYLVYQIEPNVTIDTLSLGMIINNKIDGIAPVIYNQMDSRKFLKYNISAKVSLRQYFMGTVNRQRLLGVFNAILDGLSAAEDYMIDLSLILLKPDYIFVDVSTAETALICIPTTEWQEENVDVGMFFKAMMFNTQFEQNENGDYIAKIIGYLNSTVQLSLADFRQLIKGLLNETESQDNQKAVKTPTQFLNAVPNQTIVQTQYTIPPVQSTIIEQNTPQPQIQPAIIEQDTSTIINTTTDVPKKEEKPDMGFAIPGGIAIPEESKNKKEKRQKKEKEPKVKKTKGKEIKEKKGFSIFGFGKKNESEQNVGFEVPDPNMSIQPVCPPQNAPVVPPVRQSVSAAIGNGGGRYSDVMTVSTNFGETTVLGNGSTGETVVLFNAVAGGNEKPYLTRERSRKQIVIDKPIFRIGKERSYVDYFIGDNPAISRSHANIIVREDGCYIEDTNSTNHTYVNNQLLVSGVQIKLERGAKIRLADEEFTFNY